MSYDGTPVWTKRTPLNIANFCQSKRSAALLAPLANNLNATNSYGRTAIEYARIYGHPEIVEILDKAQKDILPNNRNQC